MVNHDILELANPTQSHENVRKLELIPIVAFRQRRVPKVVKRPKNMIHIYYVVTVFQRTQIELYQY